MMILDVYLHLQQRVLLNGALVVDVNSSRVLVVASVNLGVVKWVRCYPQLRQLLRDNQAINYE